MDARRLAAAAIAAVVTCALPLATSAQNPVGPQAVEQGKVLISIDADLFGQAPAGQTVDVLFAKHQHARYDNINTNDWFIVSFPNGQTKDQDVAAAIAQALGGELCGWTSVLVPEGTITRFRWNDKWRDLGERNWTWPYTCAINVYSLADLDHGCYIDFDYDVDPSVEDRFNAEIGCATGGQLYLFVHMPWGWELFEYQPAANDTDHSVREHLLRQMWFRLSPLGFEARYAGNTGLFIDGADLVIAFSGFNNIRMSPLTGFPM